MGWVCLSSLQLHLAHQALLFSVVCDAVRNCLYNISERTFSGQAFLCKVRVYGVEKVLFRENGNQNNSTRACL